MHGKPETIWKPASRKLNLQTQDFGKIVTGAFTPVLTKYSESFSRAADLDRPAGRVH